MTIFFVGKLYYEETESEGTYRDTTAATLPSNYDIFLPIT